MRIKIRHSDADSTGSTTLFYVSDISNQDNVVAKAIKIVKIIKVIIA
jgi:hypothetical protein